MPSSPPLRLDAWPAVHIGRDMDPAWRAMRAGGLAVLVLDGSPKHVWFLCPCGCGQEVFLPGQGAPAEYRARRPWWQVEVHEEGLVTLRPSVIVLTCGAHFFVTRNRIAWCGARAQCERLQAALHR